MTSEFNQSTKRVADDIIAISILLKDRMESWDDVFTRIPDSQNVNVTTGFITNWTKPNVIEVLVEVQAPADDTKALIRTQLIETIKTNDGNERFNQVSLRYAVDYAQARQLVEKAGATTREDIVTLLHADKSQLARIVVSDETGKASKTEQLLGARYDYDAVELATIPESTEKELLSVSDTVLAKLKETAIREAKALA
jgi:hypothetical protein